MGEVTGFPTYSCRICRNPVALGDDLLSKSYVGKSGQAYMFAQAMNVVLGNKQDRELLSGLFTICEVHCCKCGEELGWKYLRAYDRRQQFKEGRFIIEKAKIIKEY